MPQTSETLFADVVLPVPIPKTFRYRVPRTLEDWVQVGQRVVVEFGKRKVVTAIIHELHHTPPEHYQAKYILEVLEEEPSVNEAQFKFWEWMSQYYLCCIGEVMNAALPSGLKLTSESYVQLNPDCLPEYLDELSPKEEIIIELLKRKSSVTYQEIGEALEVNNPSNYINKLIGRRAVLLHEQLKEKYKPKTIKKVGLNPTIVSEEDLSNTFDQLERSPKQVEILLRFTELSHRLQSGYIDKKILLKNLSASAYKGLIQKGILEEKEEIISRLEDWENMSGKPIEADLGELSDLQTNALNEILQAFGSDKDIGLLHGITGSGKTLIYAHLIKSAIDSGGQVLMLVPEIALTAQIVVRLKKFFGDEMGVYHSKFSASERVEVWDNVKSGKYRFVLGVRSAIFLPFKHLSLLVIDEEHDGSYKQQNPAPRYHARDAATVLAKMHDAKLLLGSATPSIESYYLAKHNRFALISLTERFGEAQLPEVLFADMKKDKEKKQMHGIFTSLLYEKLKATLAEEKQAIVFRNRRGYAPYLNCEDCDWIPQCRNCSVSLTYHMHQNELRCHYCGYSEKPSRTCLACGSSKIAMVGTGTEKIEDETATHFPTAKIQRMDQDTTRKKYGHQQIINDFESGKVDILVGTQMVSKGLDFEGVNLVGIIDADTMLHFPDFRAHERAFQLLTQVSGRAGRKNQGEVIIQTQMPQHPVLQLVKAQDYTSFYQREIQERKTYSYPPFSRVMRITIKHESFNVAEKAAIQLKYSFVKLLGDKRILGPEPPIISRIRNQFIQEIFIKLERNSKGLATIKQKIQQVSVELTQKKEFKKARVIIDVDTL